MKRIGILFGQERTFPEALVERINARGPRRRRRARPVGGSRSRPRSRYDLILDRISQDIPFYRAILKKAVVDGTIVVNNPFWWSADDKFFNNVLARRVGVAVPKTVILPSNQHPPDTTGESMSNLVFPLEWDEIFAYIGFPAYFKPYSGGGWKSVYRVTNPEEFFAAYQRVRPARDDAPGRDRLRRLLPLLRPSAASTCTSCGTTRGSPTTSATSRTARRSTRRSRSASTATA